MSPVEKVFGALKTGLTLKEQLNGVGKDSGDLNKRMSRLAEAHGTLRDRVSRLEGVIEGTAMASRAGAQPRIAE